MIKKIICLGVSLIMVLCFFIACENVPKGLKDKMPEIWESGYSSGDLPGVDGDLLTIDMKGVTEITLGKNMDYWGPADSGQDYNNIIECWRNEEDLENIYVEEGHPKYISQDGVLYSKSGQTLIKWPAKKPVTKPKDNIKFFAPICYRYCNISEDFELPDGTVSIGWGAFDYSTLTKIHIKENVITIQPSAFNTETLKTIEISTPIVYRTFFSSHYVEIVKFKEGVKQIRESQDMRLQEVLLPSLSTVEFPETLEMIGNVYFPVNIAVKKYVLKENLQYLSNNAFHNYYKDFSFDKIIPPNDQKRKCKTVFECANNSTSKYIEKKMPEWQKDWDTLIEHIRIAISAYKEQGSISTSIMLENYLEELLKL